MKITWAMIAVRSMWESTQPLKPLLKFGPKKNKKRSVHTNVSFGAYKSWQGYANFIIEKRCFSVILQQARGSGIQQRILDFWKHLIVSIGHKKRFYAASSNG